MKCDRNHLFPSTSSMNYDFKLYCSRHKWSDFVHKLTLRAAADCFGVVVHVVTTEHENWLLNYVPEGMTMEGGGATARHPWAPGSASWRTCRRFTTTWSCRWIRRCNGPQVATSWAL
eukprot:SAG25_NODE_1015_length_4296_cov_1.949964_7_plen_117_part_00